MDFTFIELRLLSWDSYDEIKYALWKGGGLVRPLLRRTLHALKEGGCAPGVPTLSLRDRPLAWDDLAADYIQALLADPQIGTSFREWIDVHSEYMIAALAMPSFVPEYPAVSTLINEMSIGGFVDRFGYISPFDDEVNEVADAIEGRVLDGWPGMESMVRLGRMDWGSYQNCLRVNELANNAIKLARHDRMCMLASAVLSPESVCKIRADWMRGSPCVHARPGVRDLHVLIDRLLDNAVETSSALCVMIEID